MVKYNIFHLFFFSFLFLYEVVDSQRISKHESKQNGMPRSYPSTHQVGRLVRGIGVMIMINNFIITSKINEFKDVIFTDYLLCCIKTSWRTCFVI